MTMTIDPNQQQRYGTLPFDHMSSYSNPQPHFTNPWVSSSPSAAQGPQNGNHGLFVGHEQHGLPHLNLSGLAKHTQHASRTNTSGGASMAPYGSIPVTAASAGSTLMADVYGQQDLLSMPQDLLGVNRLQHPTSSAAYPDTSYTTSASPMSATYATSTTSPTPYESMGYVSAPPQRTFALGPEADHTRRYSHSSVASSSFLESPVAPTASLAGPGPSLPPRDMSVDLNYSGMQQQDDRRSFQDALEASHGMLSMSQETPRNIYGPNATQRARGSADSYGFPSAHSTSSSVSSTFSPYYGGSVDGSVSDYSTAGSDIESLSGRTLPRPQGLMATQVPPAPQSMMGQFSSKVSSSTQKKHKCKVCDKRFTRPSSLQTHMYSHTGEKPFTCEVEGCGRQFSVVSNLRRHRKVHKGQTPSEADSEDHHSPSVSADGED